jgi:radical SAM superfamily enzyme YgiQ (UPF0313 family)
MKVLLISANTLTTPYPVYPLGLDYVADAIAADHEIKIVDINNLGEHGSLGKTVSDYSPDIIGISLRNIDNADSVNRKGFISEYREYVKAVREYSKAPLVLGGSGFTLFPAEVMEALGAEYGIIGEGERLALLLKAMEKKEDPSRIPGIMTLAEEKAIPDPFDSSFALNYVPDISRLRYYLKNGGMLNLQTKRGCTFRCIYCTYPRIEGSHLRLIPPEDAANNALRLQNSGAKYFFVIDSVFNSDYSHSIKVARAFKNAGVSIPWGAFFAPTNPPEGYFRIMADAGLSHVEFGTESLSANMLKTYKKPFGTKHIFNAHKAAIEAGLFVAHYFLLGGPGEDEDSLNETFSNIAMLNKSVLFFFALCAFIRILLFMTLQWKRARYQGLRAY